MPRYMARYPTILEIARFLEEWAPPSSAQSYDNVGLQVGDPSAEVRRGLLALDMTPQVLEEARTADASLIITHHPLIFRPLQHLTTTSFASSIAYRLASSGLALYSIHTNLDAAPGGVSFALGRTLGLSDMEFLDVFESDGEELGLGVVGRLEPAVSLAEFLERVADRLGADSLRFVGDLESRVARVAACGGAGSDFVGKALASGADVYVTADVKYHGFFDVLDNDGRPTMAFVDAGHYETEVMTEALLRDELSERFPEVDWRRTDHRTSPISTYVKGSIQR